MNPILIEQRIDFYTDFTRAPRFTRVEKSISVNDTMFEFISQEMGYEDQRNHENFQWVQRIRDNLYPLIKTSNPTVTDGAVVVGEYYSSIPTALSLPTDYDTFALLQYTIAGITRFARPTDYGQIGPMLDSSFSHPTNKYARYNESTSTMTLWRGTTGTVSSALLTYIKIPNTFSIGQDNQVLPAGTVLTNAITYYALETSVYNAITYYMGDIITGTGAALTSGQAMLVSNTTNLELPNKVHERIAKNSARKLLRSIGMLEQANAIEEEAVKE